MAATSAAERARDQTETPPISPGKARSPPKVPPMLKALATVFRAPLAAAELPSGLPFR
jgi:hypothetical protein